MQETLEIRWFFESIPDALRDWTGEVEQRKDWYAPLAGKASSVKLRESCLETKFLVEESNFRIDDSRLTLQHWAKDSRPLSSTDASGFTELGSSRWLGVGKERSVRYYTLGAGPAIRRTDASADAVQVEWTQISLTRSVQAWTFCIEAPADGGPDWIVPVAAALADELQLDVSTFPPTQSYPAWLSRRLELLANAARAIEK